MAFIPTTWNPGDKDPGAALSNGNLTFTGNVNNAARSAFSASSGKWFWEIVIGSGTVPVGLGIGKSTAALSNYLGSDADGIGWYGDLVTYYRNAVSTGYGFASGAGDVIGVALDLDAGALALYRNGVSLGTMVTGLTGTWFAMVSGNANTNSAGTANFGATAFAYAPPAGYYPGLGVLSLSALSGNVKDATGINAARLVRAYREDTGALVGEMLSDGSIGNYSIPTEHTGAHTLIFYPAVGETTLNALVRRGVVPV